VCFEKHKVRILCDFILCVLRGEGGGTSRGIVEPHTLKVPCTLLPVVALVDRAQRLGYERFALDAVPQTVMAQKLFRAVGSQETQPYYPNPVSETKFSALSSLREMARGPATAELYR